VTFLTAEALDFADRHSFHADLGEGFFHLLQLEGFDDGFDFFHVLGLLKCTGPAHRRKRSGSGGGGNQNS
jgi:hypothetical protein